MNKLEQLQQIILAEVRSLLLPMPQISDKHTEEVKQFDNLAPYDLNALFYAGLSLPTDIYTILYDQVNIPFENAFFAYLNEGESQLLAALKWAPDKNFGPQDFFNVSFENLFDIPVDVRAEEAYIVSQEKNEAGIESFEHSLSDAFEDSRTTFLNATVTSLERALSFESTTEVPLPTPITNPVTNSSPVARDSSFILFQGQLSTFVFPVFDNSGVSALSFRITSPPSLGQVFINNGTGTFTFDPGTAFDFLTKNQTQSVTFTYQAIDPQGAISGIQTISLIVTGLNHAPVANPDVAAVNENDSSVLVNVLTNDTDIDGDTLSLVSAMISSAVFAPIPSPLLTIASASVQLVGNQIEFSPGTDFDFLAAGQSATVNITYTIQDGDIQDTSTITITVNGVGTDYVVDDPVSMISDTIDGNYTKGQLSLGEALMLANTSAFPATIYFDPTITVINNLGSTVLLNDVTIDGGAGTTINYTGSPGFSTSGPDLTLNNIDLSGPFFSIIAFGGSTITLNGDTTITSPTVFISGSNIILNDNAFINGLLDVRGASVVTMNDFSEVFDVNAIFSTINMYDSSLISNSISFPLLLGSIDVPSTLNIFDPAPMNDGIHPFVGPVFASSTITINIIDHGVLPASSYITSTAGPVTINLLPIILDLDGDGVHLLSPTESGMTLENFSDGQNTDKIGWMSPGDGMLIYDYNQDGQVTSIDEFTFASYASDAKTDLEGLQLFFDTNKDNIFDSNDENFAQFGVWQDGNSNGLVEQGEYSTLSQLGITSINLISDNQHVLENGNIIFGYSTYNTADGNTHQLADVGLQILTDHHISMEGVLMSDASNDILFGGITLLQGGAGADVFVLSPLDSDVNHVIIPDFNSSEGDVLKINDVLHVLSEQEVGGQEIGGQGDVLSALDSQASFAHPSTDSTLVTFNSGDTLLINININTFHDSAIESQIVVDQPVLV